MHLPLSPDDLPRDNFAAGALLRHRAAALRRRFRGLLFHRRAHALIKTMLEYGPSHRMTQSATRGSAVVRIGELQRRTGKRMHVCNPGKVPAARCHSPQGPFRVTSIYSTDGFDDSATPPAAESDFTAARYGNLGQNRNLWAAEIGVLFRAAFRLANQTCTRVEKPYALEGRRRPLPVPQFTPSSQVTYEYETDTWGQL